MTAIYLAATYSRRKHLMRQVVTPLHAAGHRVTSRWILSNSNESVLGAEELAVDPTAGEIPGTECLKDIDEADVLAVLTDVPSSTGGYHAEVGYALGLRKPIQVVGPRLNVFHSLPACTHYSSIAAFLKAWGCHTRRMPK